MRRGIMRGIERSTRMNQHLGASDCSKLRRAELRGKSGLAKDFGRRYPGGII